MLVLNVMKLAPFPIFLLFSELLLQEIKRLFQTSNKISNTSVLLNGVVFLKAVLIHVVRVFVQILEHIEYEAIEAVKFENMESNLVLGNLFLEEIVHEFVLPHSEN